MSGSTTQMCEKPLFQYSNVLSGRSVAGSTNSNSSTATLLPVARWAIFTLRNPSPNTSATVGPQPSASTVTSPGGDETYQPNTSAYHRAAASTSVTVRP